MKFAITLLAATIFSNVCHADCMPQANAANSFMNEYIKYCVDAYNNKTKETTGHWVKRNTEITDNFKSTYAKLVEDANKEDPEMGLGSDPILDAQDYPDHGFKILSCDEQSDLVTLQGIDWEAFTVVVKTIKAERGWLVDGAGVINIPKIKRAHRD
jgi:hypothetical protein